MTLLERIKKLDDAIDLAKMQFDIYCNEEITEDSKGFVDYHLIEARDTLFDLAYDLGFSKEWRELTEEEKEPVDQF